MYILIENPTAGQGAALRQIEAIKAVFERRGLAYHVVEVADDMDVTDVAREAVACAPEGIVALGGDGTLFKIVNGMAGCDIPLLFAACGTGNDFVRVLDLPKDPVQALELQLDTPVRRIDLGKLNDLYFLNVSGTGFDVDVLRCADAYKENASGIKPYLMGLLKAMRNYKPMTAYVSIDDGPETEMRFAILSVGNGRFFGGGMRACPEATVDDGLFDVVVVSPVRKLFIPPLLVFYITGLQKKIGLAKIYRCKKLRVRRPGSTWNLDGELRDADAAEYTLLAGALCVRIPKNKQAAAIPGK